MNPGCAGCAAEFTIVSSKCNINGRLWASSEPDGIEHRSVMRTLLNIFLVLAWLSAYLGVVYAAGHYRRTRARALGVAGRDEFRAEKDLGVWFVTLVTGIILGTAAFVAAKAFGAMP